MLPKKEVLDREYRDWQISILYIRTPWNNPFPGVPGSILFGGITAILSWCLYGTFSENALIGQAPNSIAPYLTYQEIAGYFIVGVGGISWITNLSKRICAEMLASSR